MNPSQKYFSADNRSMLGDYDDNGSNRPLESIQGSSMQPADTAFCPFVGQVQPQLCLDTNQLASHINLEASNTYGGPPYLIYDTSPSKRYDSGFATATDDYLTGSSLPTGTHLTNDSQISIDQPQNAFDFDDSGWPTSYVDNLPYYQSQTQTTGTTSNPMRGPLKLRQTEPVDSKKKKRTSSSSDGNKNEVRRPVKRSKRSPACLIGASPDQESKLQQQLFEWEERNCLPTDKELRAIATLAHLPFHKVAMWYGDRLRLDPCEPASPKHSNADPDPAVINDIENYIADAGAKTCRSAHSEKADGGKYECTWGCGYSTDHRDAWLRHEEKKQPQTLWHCVICRTAQRNNERRTPFIVHRPDKFLPHSAKSHLSENAEDLRMKSKVPYDAPFIRYCNYTWGDTSSPCNHFFTSWHERNQHYFQHFEEASADLSSHDPDDGETTNDNLDDGSDYDTDDEEVEDDITEADTPAIHGLLPHYYSDGDHYPYSHHMTSQQHHHRAEVTYFSEVKRHTEDSLFDQSSVSGALQASELYMNLKPVKVPRPSLAAHWLIHIDSLQAMEAECGMPYLALKYSAREGPSVKCLQLSQSLPRPMPPALEALPKVFRKVLDLAKNLGFQYIWIDIFCGLKNNVGGINAVYKQANLILVVGHPSHLGDQIWHFTCDYNHLDMVQSWAKQSVSFHHLKQLGHGAFGVVDEVELRPTHEIFARKIIFCTDSERLSKARRFQEIDIMRKLRHPHIATFIAAYFDHGAFNILMSPVADCDLRRYLTCPQQFPEKREYVASWFMSLAEALAYIHGNNCRHRDIKPANILISGRTVLLTDFGTSLDFSTSRSTSIGSCLMTPKYCSPEVAAHGLRGRSADVFSLGCVFAEMITVEVGKSLEDMDKCLNIEADSTDRQATYHCHLRGLLIWLQRLGRLCLDTFHSKILRLSMAMLNRNPQRRPTALVATKALCSKVNCTGLKPGASCHCCPRDVLDAAPVVELDDTKDLCDLPENIGAGLQDQLCEIQGGNVSKYASETLRTAINFSPALNSQFDITPSLHGYNSFSFSVAQSKEQIGFWDAVQAARLIKGLKACWRGLDALPSMTCEYPAEITFDQTGNNRALEKTRCKGSVGAFQVAYSGGSGMLSVSVS